MQRSFKVTDPGTIRNPACDFLLVINSNLHLHNFITQRNINIILEACVSVCRRRQVVVWWLVCVSTPRCRYQAPEYSDTRPTRCLLVMMTSHRSKSTDTVSQTETSCTFSCLCHITRLLLHRSRRWFCLYLLTYLLTYFRFISQLTNLCKTLTPPISGIHRIYMWVRSVSICYRP